VEGVKMSLKQAWNESNQSVPVDKSPSYYAIEKEKLFPRGAKVCDLAGGTGADCIYFLQKGHIVTNLDIADTALEASRKKAATLSLDKNFQTIECDLSAGTIPIPSDTFDIVFSHLGLHYFLPERLTEIFQEIYRILKPDGQAFITLKSPADTEEMAYLRETAEEIAKDVFDDGGKIKSRYGKERITQFLQDSGISHFNIQDYNEQFTDKIDRVKSGKKELLQIEIEFTK
jgi:ubiquinone/menaquinone biosynthesis C-methylase UbiE